MEEMLDVVDENDMVVRKATRKEVRGKGLLHKCARVIIINNNGELMLQKRTMTKDIYPGHWDIGVAETVKSGESYEEAAARGLKEEAGIKANPSELNFLFEARYKSKNNNAKTHVYACKYNGKVIPQEEEIDEIGFMAAEDVKEIIGKIQFHPVGKIVFEKYLEQQNINI